MDSLFLLLLILHITGGSVGLLSGLIVLLRIKGDRLHKLIGKVFSYAMLITGFSALALSLMRPNHFLFIIGVFTVYLVGTGHRYIYVKMLGSQQRPALLDWMLSILMLIAGIIFIILGIRHLLGLNYFGIVFLVFGVIGLFFVKSDLSHFKGKTRFKNYWLIAHLQRMTGGYIAAITAFLVVNANNMPITLPGVFFWLLPTVVLTPLIVIWTRKRAIPRHVPVP